MAALFLRALLLDSLSKTQGKIAMDGNFSHIAPRTALYDDPNGINNLTRLFRKSAIKNTAANPPHPSSASSLPHLITSHPHESTYPAHEAHI